ncbi:hypothetical protein HK414_20465 [Ramlibacter terrae]|uniref:Toxin CptA n=1 Tax=Ramlibacter terrae TaxID=2732511 RepID=A0ABX6P4J2_9BURK|nr:hypothetical protein HK414_20465 [Ramlibacter terrae]
MGRSRFALGVLAFGWAAGLAPASLWTVQADAAGWRQALAFGAVAVAGALAAAAWLRSPHGRLAWDGGGWRWEEEGGRPEIALDLQSRMLLRWRSDAGAVRWLAPERNAAPAHWDALRRAVYSPASTDAPHGAAPPVARR